MAAEQDAVIVGGACVMEEVFPGVKFSRPSCSAGLLRPEMIRDPAHPGGAVTGAPGRSAARVALEDLRRIRR